MILSGGDNVSVGSDCYSEEFIVKSSSIRLKFFKSELICACLTNYLSKKFDVNCVIPSTAQHEPTVDLRMQLLGVKANVKNAHQDLQTLFAAVKTTTFDDEKSALKGECSRVFSVNTLQPTSFTGKARNSKHHSSIVF